MPPSALCARQPSSLPVTPQSPSLRSPCQWHSLTAPGTTPARGLATNLPLFPQHSIFYITFAPTSALVAKLVDAPDLGSGVARRVGSSPIRRTLGRRSNPQWLLRRPYFFWHCTSSGASLRKAHRITPIIKAAITGFTPTLQPLRNPIVLCLSTKKKTMDKSTRFAALIPILHRPCGFCERNDAGWQHPVQPPHTCHRHPFPLHPPGVRRRHGRARLLPVAGSRQRSERGRRVVENRCYVKFFTYDVSFFTCDVRNFT